MSKPLLLSVPGSPFWNSSVVKAPFAVNVWETGTQFRVLALVLEFVSLNVCAPLSKTFTVLVEPKIPPPVVFPIR